MFLQAKACYDIDTIDSLKCSSNPTHREIIKDLIEKHYDTEMDAETNLDVFLALFLEKIYPNDLVYTENQANGNTTGLVFEMPREILIAIRVSLELPWEDLPGEINTIDPINKLITDWRLKNG